MNYTSLPQRRHTHLHFPPKITVQSPSTPDFSKWKKLMDDRSHLIELKKAKDPDAASFAQNTIDSALKANMPVLAQRIAQEHKFPGEVARIAKLRAEQFLRENPNSYILGREEHGYDNSPLNYETQSFAQYALYTPHLWIEGVSDILPKRKLLKIVQELIVEFMVEAERQNNRMLFHTAFHIAKAYSLTELEKKIIYLEGLMSQHTLYAEGKIHPASVSSTFFGICSMGRRQLNRLPAWERYLIYGRVAHELGQPLRALECFRKAEKLLRESTLPNKESRLRDITCQIAQTKSEIVRKTN